MVPVDEAEDAEEAEEESSSDRSVGCSENESLSSSSSIRSTNGSGRTGGSPDNFAFAKARCRSLILVWRSWWLPLDNKVWASVTTSRSRNPGCREVPYTNTVSKMSRSESIKLDCGNCKQQIIHVVMMFEIYSTR